MSSTKGHAIINEPVDGLEPAANDYDVVRARHVIEHTANPAQALDFMIRSVRVGGHLIVELPNPSGIPARLGRSSWWQLDPPRHLVIPTPRMLLRQLAEAGFDADFGTKTSGAGLANTIVLAVLPRLRKKWSLASPKGRVFWVLARALEPAALVLDALRLGDDSRIIAKRQQ